MEIQINYQNDEIQ